VNVFDSSALLAYVNDEPGGKVVANALDAGGVVPSPNWAEVAQKVRAAGADWDAVRGALLSFELAVVPVTMDDAEVAAELWQRGAGLSLGDRLCLAVAARLDGRVLTADQQWSAQPRVKLIR
jgi:PIN domain nuclease of toxin-antitoxin system